VPLPLAAERHYAYQQQVTAAVVRAAQLAWARVTLADLDGSWAAVAGGLLTLVTAAQVAAARDADPYLAAVLAEMGHPDDPAGQVQPAAFAGVASDGRGLASLLAEPLITVKVGLKARTAPERALASGGSQLEMLAQTTVQDTGRAAVSAGMIARPHIDGYVRVLTLPSCSRCAILAGRVYRWSTGFQRHPRCFPAGTVVSGPPAEATTRRWYEGELTIIRTASGKKLAVTGNHPVLTLGGWIPAHLVQEGNDVVSRTSGDRAVGLLTPHEDQMPALIEDVWRSGRMDALTRMPVAAEDFHGDGFHGEVDVVPTDGLLRDRVQATLLEQMDEVPLTIRAQAPVSLAGLGISPEFTLAAGAFTGGILRGSGLGRPLSGAHLRGAHQASSTGVTDLYASPAQSWADGRAGDVEASTEGVLTLAAAIGSDDLVPWGGDLGPRWDAPADPFSIENLEAHTRRGVDLLRRLAGQVAADRVVEVQRVQWRGHVYNLTSREGWYCADGFIVSNCDCRMLPQTVAAPTGPAVDPDEALRSGQIRGLSKAEEAAISDGADLNQIVNAHRSGAYQGMTTAEGVTRRGVAGKRLQGRQRLTVGAIQRLASDREEAVRLLIAHGYILR
jgi:hypothetical protein